MSKKEHIILPTFDGATLFEYDVVKTYITILEDGFYHIRGHYKCYYKKGNVVDLNTGNIIKNK